MSPEAQSGVGPQETRPVRVSVIIPARNEEACLGDCLRTIVAQQGAEFEVIVVDDQSTDKTRAVAESFPGVRVISTKELPAGWSGKCAAVWAGAQAARGEWLLFTDADTVHLPGSLQLSLSDAQQRGLSLLSYSPEQEVHGLVQWAVMPAIFAELASSYPPADVCDPKSSVAAANGQYLLISREAYEAVGGHRAVASSLLEDLELAKLVKASGRAIRLKYGKGLVRTRMYRDTRSLVEGWTKNLALLFPQAGKLALTRAAEFAAIMSGVAGLAWLLSGGDAGITPGKLPFALLGLGLLVWLRVLKRVSRAHFGIRAQVMAPLGLPIFSYLLWRSRLYYKGRKQITWKGRVYCPSNPQSSNESSQAATSARGAQSCI